MSDSYAVKTITPEQLEHLRQAASQGATWQDMAAILGVTTRTLQRWRTGYDPSPMDRMAMLSREERPLDAGEEITAGAVLEAIQEGWREGRVKLLGKMRDLVDCDHPATRLKATESLLARLDGMKV